MVAYRPLENDFAERRRELVVASPWVAFGAVGVVKIGCCMPRQMADSFPLASLPKDCWVLEWDYYSA